MMVIGIDLIYKESWRMLKAVCYAVSVHRLIFYCDRFAMCVNRVEIQAM